MMAPPSLVSAMSMSITPQVPSESFGLKRSSSTTTDISALDASFTKAAAVQEVPSGLKGQETAAKSDALGKRVLSNKEISMHKSEDDAWIVVDGKVYDVTQFLETHPGGPELILDHLQSGDSRDAGPLMKGKIDEDGHSHSKAAFRMLEQFLIGSVEESSRPPVESKVERTYRHTVDITKPIVAQVGYLGEDYDDWVHDPIVSKEIPRMFESDIQEFFTRTKWWVIPLVWCPVAFTMIYQAVVKEGLPAGRLPALTAIGITVWTLLEYVIHRFFFHMKTSSFWGNTFHYVIHGFHHKFPMDGARLVFPPAFTSVVCLFIWILMGNWITSYPNKLVVYASALLTYVAYDLTHYFLHFGTAFNDKSRKMKRYHLNHHFKDQTNGYGITTIFWDKTFGTLPAAKLSAD